MKMDLRRAAFEAVCKAIEGKGELLCGPEAWTSKDCKLPRPMFHMQMRVECTC